jgi:hypothetical protein
MTGVRAKTCNTHESRKKYGHLAHFKWQGIRDLFEMMFFERKVILKLEK